MKTNSVHLDLPVLLLLGILAFSLEVLAVIALYRWGWQAGQTTPGRWLLATLVPLAFMLFWGTFLSPKATIPLSDPMKSALQLLVFGLAALAASSIWTQTISIGFFLFAAGTVLLARITEVKP